MNNLVKTMMLMTILIFSFSCTKEAIVDTSHDHRDTELYYTCSMHPQIRETKPGKCPICHMNLTKIEVDKKVIDPKEVDTKLEMWQCENYPEIKSDKSEVCPIDGTPMIKLIEKNLNGETVAKVRLRKSQLNHFQPEFFKVTSMKMTKNIRLLGTVLQSEEKESNIPARIEGRVEKVYVKSTGSLIKSGDPIIDIYSPQLITTGEEYIIARKSFEKTKNSEFKDMLEQSKERLKLWGVKASQFEKWYLAGGVPKNITLYANVTGIVRTKNASKGKYFKEGQNFFELSDLSDVWVEMDVYEYDSALVELGQLVNLEFTAIPGEVQKGEIDFIDPVLDRTSRTLKVRATIENTNGKLKPGMIANAQLMIDIPGMPLVIPRTAIIDTGKRKVVWIKVNHNEFQAITIQTGYESQGYVEVKAGLSLDDEIVIDGNFLLDAQAQLFGGYDDPKFN